METCEWSPSCWQLQETFQKKSQTSWGDLAHETHVCGTQDYFLKWAFFVLIHKCVGLRHLGCVREYFSLTFASRTKKGAHVSDAEIGVPREVELHGGHRQCCSKWHLSWRDCSCLIKEDLLEQKTWKFKKRTTCDWDSMTRLRTINMFWRKTGHWRENEQIEVAWEGTWL